MSSCHTAVSYAEGDRAMLFVFGECELDVERRELRRAGVVRPLEPKAFTVLVHLLTQHHRAVAKDELLAICWPNEFVTEAALTRCLKVIRQAVADDGARQHTINADFRGAKSAHILHHDPQHFLRLLLPFVS